MTEEIELEIRKALAIPAPAPEPFSLGVIAAYHRQRAHRALLRRYAIMSGAALALAIAALPLAILLADTPIAIARGGVATLLLVGAVAWSFATATRPSPQR
jgi:hypothetical protein